MKVLNVVLIALATVVAIGAKIPDGSINQVVSYCTSVVGRKTAREQSCFAAKVQPCPSRYSNVELQSLSE